MSDYPTFFAELTEGLRPYPYQVRIAEEPWPDLADVPTGMGKTAAFVVAWLWRRLQGDPDTPRRLVYCLPMRTLVEQTHKSAKTWIGRAAAEFERRGLAVPLLSTAMGGQVDEDWVRNPERPAIVVGTQDMLLSRALMRGYGMSCFAWSIPFALLHNDASWLFDEVQLMGPGVATSAQLEAFRRSFPLGLPSRSTWCSATIDRAWLETIDLEPHVESFRVVEIGEEDRQQASGRLEAVKSVHPARTRLDAGSKKATGAYLEGLRDEILDRHRPGKTTLVILNRVERAQGLFELLRRSDSEADPLLLHGRFRSDDRGRHEKRLRQAPEEAGRIVVSTQVVEAGVDTTSAVLFTELCPWASFVQRCGRANRYGEENEHGGAEVLWIDLDTDAREDALPYSGEDLAVCRRRLADLTDASPSTLSNLRFEDPVPEWPVLRRRDLLDLFDTEPDLAGFQIDVSPYIRDADETGVQVFWRALGGNPPDPDSPQPAPERRELCSVSVTALREALGAKRSAWRWDHLAERWQWVGRRDVYPGLTLMLAAEAGGYDPEIGFAPRSKAKVKPLPPEDGRSPEGNSSDRLSRGAWVELEPHLERVAGIVAMTADALDVPAAARRALVTAAAWHDVGKAHEVFQSDLLAGLPDDDSKRGALWAKSDHRRKWRDPDSPRVARRRAFRHELASALAYLALRSSATDGVDRDLVAYLIAAHHGKVRLSLRALPQEPAPPPTDDGAERLFARGVWEGDRLPPEGSPPVRLPAAGPSTDSSADPLPPVVLDRELLALARLGEGAAGPSWSARTQVLLDERGPFALAWLEALLRLADWRGSAEEDA